MANQKYEWRVTLNGGYLVGDARLAYIVAEEVEVGNGFVDFVKTGDDGGAYTVAAFNTSHVVAVQLIGKVA